MIWLEGLNDPQWNEFDEWERGYQVKMEDPRKTDPDCLYLNLKLNLAEYPEKRGSLEPLRWRDTGR